MLYYNFELMLSSRLIPKFSVDYKRLAFLFKNHIIKATYDILTTNQNNLSFIIDIIQIVIFVKQ